VLFVWNACEWQGFFGPILFESISPFGTEHQYDCILLDELFVILAQLRHMCFAVWSGKAAIKNEQDVFVAFELG
jgi:hypothetical protein